MLLIELAALDNGAHRNQRSENGFNVIPEGYAKVAPELEETAWGYLPFINITEVTEGVITGVEQGTIPPPEPEPVQYVPTAETSAVMMMRANFMTALPTMEDDEVIRYSGLADDWAPGVHEVGDVYNTRMGGDLDDTWEQTWECYQEYDNSVYPDIIPGNPAWYTFNRPLHGKTPETARPFVPVQGSHDMYRTGEYMVFTDGKIYECVQDTNFSPTEYAQAWKVREAS